MFALVALFLFVLKLFHVDAIGPVDVEVLAFAFIAAHLAWGIPWRRWRSGPG
jgi:hypothetical protein